jgi:transaldolase
LPCFDVSRWASFRNVGEILELAGCDLLTIRAELMKQVSGSHESVAQKQSPEKSKGAGAKQLELDEKKIPVSRDGDRGNRGGHS